MLKINFRAIINNNYLISQTKKPLNLRDFLLATHRQRGDWPRAARQLGFDVEAFVCTDLSQQAGLPWDFLASERQMQRLHREHDRALALCQALAHPEHGCVRLSGCASMYGYVG